MTTVLQDSKNINTADLFPIVGVGASAGGVEAFKELIKAIPSDSKMAYILVQHLAADHESVLTDILQKHTAIPIIEIADDTKVQPNHIYVIPSNKILTINDSGLNLETRIQGEHVNTIDVFLTSLAELQQQNAIGVVLSGTGKDGTVGLKTIKDQGGITIAQSEPSAAYFSMPQNAIRAEVVDYVLSPGEIPNLLSELVKDSKVIIGDANLVESLDQEEVFRQILTILRAKRGVDFTYYKQTTIRRRILRRKAMQKADSLKAYLTFLLENRSEQDALYQDLLIPVTAFFRDPSLYDVVCKKIFPALFNVSERTEPIRIWIAGCATGEEAYSMAICLHEFLGSTVSTKKIQIFATDLSETVIAKARSGIYQKKDLAALSPERIKQFFNKIDGSYQVVKEIREMCVFACQNFLKDPPFAKLDIISCRNVLIYLEPHLQKKALNTFHYALKSKGYLILGNSETIGQSSEQFITFSQPDKIYQRKEGISKFMHVASIRTEANLKQRDDRLTQAAGKKDDLQKAADNALLSKYATVGVIVNDELEIVHFRGYNSAYLEMPPGKASLNLLKMAKEGLSFELRTAIHKARSNNTLIRKEGIAIEKGKRLVTIEVIPLLDAIEPHYLVLFEDVSADRLFNANAKGTATPGGTVLNKNERHRIEQLENELSQLREDMRSITEDQEATNEELQSANEELLSSSEELQTLNEELETSREEIQSSNEELTIINQELIERNEQLIYSRKYAEAIVSTIHDPLLILTNDWRIKSANKAFFTFFNVTEDQTEGKNLMEWNNGLLNVADLNNGLQKFLLNPSSLAFFEVTMKMAQDREHVLMMNARQIINESSKEKLILLAIQDITAQKSFEQKLSTEIELRTRELHEANQALLQSNESLQQFASIASHDLQEPIRKVKTFTSLLRRRFGNAIPTEANEIIDKINTATDRMSQLIKELLQFSKIVHSGKEFIATDLDSTLKMVLSDLDLLCAETGAQISYTQPLPQISAIPLQMHQLFYNLLTNALKFYDKATNPIITITCKPLTGKDVDSAFGLNEKADYIELCFTDNGIGFEQQFAEQIFQLFERLHSLDEFEGTGLGLALCKKIVENHKGIIYAKSKENEGASFYVILPVLHV